jgi:hypothetical protein
MLNIFRKHYKEKVNELYKRIEANKEDAIIIRNFIEYHSDMLLGMDTNIIRTTGPLDAILCFYQRDLTRTLQYLRRTDLTDKLREEYENLVSADEMVIAELTLDGTQVKPEYNALYVDMALLEKLNNKLPEEDRVDVKSLYVLDKDKKLSKINENNTPIKL